jgi:hypothetical protein
MIKTKNPLGETMKVSIDGKITNLNASDFLILNECWGKNYAYIAADRLIQLANQAKIKNNFKVLEK